MHTAPSGSATQQQDPSTKQQQQQSSPTDQHGARSIPTPPSALGSSTTTTTTTSSTSKSRKNKAEKKGKQHDVAKFQQVEDINDTPSSETKQPAHIAGYQDDQQSTKGTDQQQPPGHDQGGPNPAKRAALKAEKRKRQKERKALQKLALRGTEDVLSNHAATLQQVSIEASLDEIPTSNEVITVRLPPSRDHQIVEHATTSGLRDFHQHMAASESVSSPSSSYHPSSVESRPSSRALTVSSHTTSRSDARTSHSKERQKEEPHPSIVSSKENTVRPTTASIRDAQASNIPGTKHPASTTAQANNRSIVAYLSKLERPPYFAFTAPQDMSLIYNESNSKAYIDFRSRRPMLVMRISLPQTGEAALNDGTGSVTVTDVPKKKKKKGKQPKKVVEVLVPLTPRYELVQKWQKQVSQFAWNPKNDPIKIRLARNTKQTPPTAPTDQQFDEQDQQDQHATVLPQSSEIDHRPLRPSMSRRASAPILSGEANSTSHEEPISTLTSAVQQMDLADARFAVRDQSQTTPASGIESQDDPGFVGGPIASTSTDALGRPAEDAPSAEHSSLHLRDEFQNTPAYAESLHAQENQYGFPPQSSPLAWAASSTSSEMAASSQRMGAYNQPFYAPDGSLWILDEYSRTPVPYRRESAGYPHPAAQNDQYFPLYKASSDYREMQPSSSYYSPDPYQAYDPYGYYAYDSVPIHPYSAAPAPPPSSSPYIYPDPYNGRPTMTAEAQSYPTPTHPAPSSFYQNGTTFYGPPPSTYQGPITPLAQYPM